MRPDISTHQKNLVVPVYGDTDSLYLCYENLLKTIDGYETMSLDEKCNILVNLNTQFLDKYNQDFI